jgi:hypothetical protein
LTSTKVATRLNRLTSDPSFAHNLERQYQINRRAGGVSRAVDLVEDVLLWDGNLSHLIPVNERASFFQRTNADLYLLFALLAGFFIKKFAWPFMQPLSQRYRIRAQLEAITSKAVDEVLVGPDGSQNGRVLQGQ